MSEPLTTEADLSQCILMNTIKTARVLSRRYDSRLKPHGITVAQFSIMMIIRHNQGKTINAVAEKIAIDRSAFSRNVDLLVAKGLVVKEKTHHGNAKTCCLTEAGDSKLDAAIPLWLATRNELRALMAGKDPYEYLSVLKALSKG